MTVFILPTANKPPLRSLISTLDSYTEYYGVFIGLMCTLFCGLCSFAVILTCTWSGVIWCPYDSVAGLPCTGNYHKVTAGAVPPLIVLIHARGWQGWRAAEFGSGCCHLLRPHPRGEATWEPAAQGVGYLSSDRCTGPS